MVDDLTEPSSASEESSQVEVGSISEVSGGEINISGRDLRRIEAGTYVERAIYVTRVPDETEHEQGEPPAPGEPPFKGLQYFDVADAGLFFGRELLVARLLNRLWENRFLAVVVGASGSGKSSILRAGMISALRSEQPLADGSRPPVGSSQWPVHLITPTAHPLEALAASLTRDSESVTATATLIDDMQRDSRSLHLYVRKLLGHAPAERLLVVVDQFEEVFTMCKSELERKTFLSNLLTAVAEETDGPTIVVIALRADFYAHCGQYENLRIVLAKYQEYIGPMGPDELRRAIEEPARQGGWELEPGLVDLLLRDVGADGNDPPEPGALPLLSHALLETWKRRQGRRLTHQGYIASGGVQGAVAKTAEDVYQRLTPEGQSIAFQIFLHLTELGEEGSDGLPSPDTRRRAALSDLIPHNDQAPAVEAVLQILTNARLITTGEGSAEVAHEALIREWPTLRRWLAENREWLKVHRQINQDAQEWLAAGREESLLYRGTRLAGALDWAEQHSSELSQLERNFLEAARLLQARELEDARSRAAQLRRRAILLGVALVLALVAAMAAAVFWSRSANIAADNATLAAQMIVAAQQAEAGESTAQAASTHAVAQQATAEAEAQIRLEAQAQAEAQGRVALGRQLAAQAINDLDSRYDLALLLSLEANHIYPSTESRSSLFTALGRNPNLVAFISAHSSAVRSLALSPDGQVLASGGDDGMVIFWDFETRQPLGPPFSGHSGKVLDLAFSQDGQILASAGSDRLVILWDVAQRRPLGEPLSGHKDRVTSVVFSPDDSILASSSFDGTVILWDRLTRQPLDEPLAAHTARVYQVAFHPSGETLASVSADQTVILWDVATRQPTGEPLLGHSDRVYSLAFSSDGNTLVTGGDDNTVLLWDLETGQPAEPINLPYPVGEVAFSPAGDLLAVGSGNAIYLWDLASGGWVGPPFVGQIESVDSLVFSPDGQRLVSNGYRAALLWEVGKRLRLARSLKGHTNWVRSVIFSPDGSLLASGADDRSVLLWDAHSGEQLGRLASDDALEITSLAFSHDGVTLFSSTFAKIQLWDVATNELFAQSLQGHTDWVRQLALHPDGNVLASGSYDGTVILWDLTTFQPVGPPLDGDTGQIYRAAFSPDGTILASGGEDGRVLLWDATTLRQIGTPLVGHTDLILSLAFSPDGRLLASGSADKTIQIWDVSSQEPVSQTLIGHNSWVLGLAFSPDGRLLASSSADNTIVLWDMASLQVFGQPIVAHTDRVWSVAFSPDGNTMASGSGDNMVMLWDVSFESWRELACQVVNRNLTQAEWAQHLPGVPYRQTCPQFPAGE